MGIHWTLRFSMMRCGPLLTNAGQNDILQKLAEVFEEVGEQLGYAETLGIVPQKIFLCGRSGVEHHHGGGAQFIRSQ